MRRERRSYGLTRTLRSSAASVTLRSRLVAPGRSVAHPEGPSSTAHTSRFLSSIAR